MTRIRIFDRGRRARHIVGTGGLAVALLAGLAPVLLSALAPDAGPVAAAAPTGQASMAAPASGALFGAYASPLGVAQTPSTVNALESSIGRKLDIDRVYSDWGTSQPQPQAVWDVANGIVPLISIDATTSSGAPVPWSQIASGADDAAIVAQAQGIASLGSPVLLNFSHEPGLHPENGTAADFVAAWQHYVTVVRQYAPNVSFALILDSEYYSPAVVGPWYPGDAYVDWMGADGYNSSTCRVGQVGAWRDFSAIFGPLESFAVAHAKPAVIAEWASTEDPSTPGRKAAWITAAAQTMESWPQMKAALYFDAPGFADGCQWPLDSSPSALAAFNALGAQSWFNTGPQGYWEVSTDGGIFAYGTAAFYGSMGGKPLNAPIVRMAVTPDDKGYLEVGTDGGIFAFGTAGFYGSMGGRHLNAPIVGIAVTPDGKGYWEVSTDGGIFAFGTAGFYGSMGGRPLNAPIVGIAVTPDGKGYWEVGADGGIYSFGSAAYFGSMGGRHLNAPIVGMATTLDGNGYWEVGADGGVYTFGSATYFGSTGSIHLNRPVMGVAAVPDGDGYWMVASDGGIFSFGSAGFYGSMGGKPLDAPVVAIAS
jgi:hypothetical protein